MSGRKLRLEDNTAFFGQENVVEHYVRATAVVGLWRSEEIVFTRVFKKDDRIIDLGCGTGRISIGLTELGYRHLLGLEISGPMVKEARRIVKILECEIPFRVGDARDTGFEDGLFDGAIFGFNGLMQIPGRDERRRALAEIYRILQPGGHLVFTSHFQESDKHRKHWNNEAKRWERGVQLPELIDFGDRYEQTDLGQMFIHVPRISEVQEDLEATGWVLEWEMPRSQIANEPQEVREFSDECRFWCAVKKSPITSSSFL